MWEEKYLLSVLHPIVVRLQLMKATVEEENGHTCANNATHKYKIFIVRHRRSHTDERPYSCSVCNQAFRESAVCKNHIMSQHSDSADAIVIVNLVNRKPYELVLKKRKTITHVNQLPKLSQELLAHSETQDSNFTKQSTESFFGIDENNFQEPYGYSLSLLDATKL